MSIGISIGVGYRDRRPPGMTGRAFSLGKNTARSIAGAAASARRRKSESVRFAMMRSRSAWRRPPLLQLVALTTEQRYVTENVGDAVLRYCYANVMQTKPSSVVGSCSRSMATAIAFDARSLQLRFAAIPAAARGNMRATAGAVKTGTRLYGQCPIIARIAATRMIARYAHSPSSPAPSARRYAASGLDRLARPSKQADRAVDANL